MWGYVHNKDNSVSQILLRKKKTWLKKPKYPHQPQVSVPGMVKQQPPKVEKPWANKVQETEAEDEDEAVVEEGVVTKYVADEAGM